METVTSLDQLLKYVKSHFRWFYEVEICGNVRYVFSIAGDMVFRQVWDLGERVRCLPAASRRRPVQCKGKAEKK